MAELLSHLEVPSDAELISLVRAGDTSAYGELFARHVDAARRLAKQLVRGPDSEDLVSEAFAKVMAVLQDGGGPDLAFRAYLLTAVRRLHVDRIRRQSRVTTTDDLTPFDRGVPFQDTAVEKFESGAAAQAFASLPERWQLVLWHLEVEGQKPAEVAPLLGMSPNSVSALAYRAREGLRQAFLTAHLAEVRQRDGVGETCGWVAERLGAYVRSGLSKRDTDKVRSHLDECRSCAATCLELSDVNSNLRGVLAPIVLGGLAAGYLSAGGVSATGGLAGVGFMLGRVKDVVTANTATVGAGAAAATVAAVTTFAVVISGGNEEAVVAAEQQQSAVVDEAGLDAPPTRDHASPSSGVGRAGADGKSAGGPAGSDRGAGASGALGPVETDAGDTLVDTRPGTADQTSGAPDAAAPDSTTPGLEQPPGTPPSGQPSQPGPPGDDGAPGKPKPNDPPPPATPDPPRHPDPKPQPKPTPPAADPDLRLSLRTGPVVRDVQRLHAQVAGMHPAGKEPTPLRFAIDVGDARVRLVAVPDRCSASGLVVTCQAPGATFNGTFGFDVSDLPAGIPVRVAFTVTSPGQDDPQMGNNSAAVTF